MAIVIDASVGGIASNSYLTLQRANVLLEQLPHADDWFDDYSINKVQLLVHATRLIDRSITFCGTKVSSAQSLQWPRLDVTDPITGLAVSSATIPDFVEWATVEWAYDLHVNPDAGQSLAPGFNLLRTPSYTAEFRGGGKKSMPDAVAELLLTYGDRTPRGIVRLIRT